MGFKHITTQQFDKLPKYAQDELSFLQSELERTQEELAISRDRKFSRVGVCGDSSLSRPESYIPENKTISIKTKSGGTIYIRLTEDKTGIQIAEYGSTGKQLITFPSGGVNTLRISLINLNKTEIKRG